MANRSVIRLTVVEVDEIMESIREMLHIRDLDVHGRRMLGLALERLTNARQRSKGRKVTLTRHEVTLSLRCLANVGDYIQSLWREHFGD